jgi:putative tryptophan/tyrosine transport system substrate-binding protein
MRRREVLALTAGAAATWPSLAWAQQTAMPVIGFLGAVAPDGFAERTRGFRQGLKESGFSEGENVMIDYRWAENQLERLPGLAADLVRKRVAVIVATGGTTPAVAAKAATATIPIVFTIPEDPVALGLVASLSRPGGNLTGVNLVIGELMSKRLELLREIVPGIARVAVFVNSANPVRAESQVREAESAGGALKLQVQIIKVAAAHEISAAFATLAKDRPDALFVSPDPFFIGRRVQLATQAARHAIPTSFSTRDFPEAGGLMSYGTNIVDAYRQAGVYTGQILKGAKPADMPVVQAAKFEMVINVETARMLGLAIPSSLLTRADEVIE